MSADCPECGSNRIQAERRPDGNTRCTDCGWSRPSSHWSEVVWLLESNLAEAELEIKYQRQVISDLRDEIGKLRRL